MWKNLIGTWVDWKRRAPLRDLKEANFNAGHYVKAQHSKTVDSSTAIYRIGFGVFKKQAINKKKCFHSPYLNSRDDSLTNLKIINSSNSK